MRLNLTLTLRSDYHVGAGHGLGSRVDSALLRDADNVPVIRGTTLEGILRDGLWRLLQTPALAARRPPHPASKWCPADPCPVCLVFGTPGSPKRWHVRSARPAGAGTPLGPAGHRRCQETAAQVSARVRVSPRQRRAEPGKLFQQEEGDGRLVFRFSIERPGYQPTACEEAAWLLAAARMVRRFGSARRRGRGECLITLDSVEGWPDSPRDGNWQAHLLVCFRGCLEGTPVRREVAPAQWTSPHPSGSGPLRFRLIVRLDEPVVLARRAEAGNLFDCLDAVPGTTVLGAFAQQAASRYDLSASDVYGDFLDVFRRGHVRFSPLYPAQDSSGILYPCIPAPLDLLVCKARHEIDAHHPRVASYARRDVPDDCSVCRISIPLVPLDGFVTVRPAPASFRTGSRQEMHQQVSPETQRVATGNLYGYTALESGQYFMGVLWCRDQRAWQTLVGLTGIAGERQAFHLRMGKATRRGYGLGTAWLEPLDTDPWRAKPLEERVVTVSEPVTLTLLTDAILADLWGRFYQSFDTALVGEIVGHSVRLINVFCKSGYVDGFNAHLGLPRWRDVCLRAGSAVGFHFAAGADLASVQARLRAVEADGIGLRRNEGFGQVVFNHPVYDYCHGVKAAEWEVPGPLRLASSPEQQVAGELWSEADALERWTDETLPAAEAFASPEWEPVARWLHDSADRPPTELRQELDRFGNASVLTRERRERKGFFQERDKMEPLKGLLDGIDRYAPPLQRRMVRLLADAIAAGAKKAREEA